MFFFICDGLIGVFLVSKHHLSNKSKAQSASRASRCFKRYFTRCTNVFYANTKRWVCLNILAYFLILNVACRFDTSNLTTYLNAARCASAWIQLGGVNIDDCSNLMNVLIDLTCFVYW